MTLPLPQTESCYLCGIVKDAIGSWNLVEDSELTLTILNGRQFETGQCMVLPKRHAPTILDLTEAEDSAVMAAAKRVTAVFLNEFSPSGVLVYQNNGTGSGQEVPHFHLHVVPRREGSNWGFGPPHIARLEHSDASKYADYTAITDEKVSTVSLLRKHFGR